MSALHVKLKASAQVVKSVWTSIKVPFQKPGLKAAWKETKVTTGNTIFLSALFIITAWFSQTTFAPSSDGHHQSVIWSALARLGVSNTLTVLRILQASLTTMSGLMLHNVFDIIVWVLAKKRPGIKTLRLLAFSSATGPWGTLGLLFSHHISFVDRMIPLVKLLLLTMAWLSGILLFARTKITVVNRTAFRYNATSGVGIFRGSYVPEFLSELQSANPSHHATIVPYSTVIRASQLITHPAHSTTMEPVNCDNPRLCDSYLLPGGLASSTPWPPTDYTDYPTITLHSAPAAQLDFKRVLDYEQSFTDSRDCLVFGATDSRIGIQFCLAESTQNKDSLLAGLFVCEEGMRNGKCVTDIDPPRIVTLLTAYQRQATVTCARSNSSIIAIRDLTTPIQQVGLQLAALKQSFSWLADSAAADVPISSSVAQYFWSSKDLLNNVHYSMEPYLLFQSLMAFPFWFFNDDNIGNIHLDRKRILESLPEEFHTFATVDKPMHRIAVDRGMFIAFCCLQTICISCVWAVLICRWVCYHDMPNISSYPVIDFALKTHHRTTAVEASIRTTLHLGAGDKDIREALKHEYTMTCNAKHDPSRHGSTTSPEDESDSEPQQVLLGDEGVEMMIMSAPDEALAPHRTDGTQIRRKPLSSSPVPGSEES